MPFVGSTEAPLREVTVDGDHWSNKRFLEASAPLRPEGVHLSQHSQPSPRGCPFAIPRPSCSARGARFRERRAWVTSRGLRNREMVEAGADLCIALHRSIETSKGTKDCVGQAVAAGIPVYLVEDERAIPRRVQADRSAASRRSLT